MTNPQSGIIVLVVGTLLQKAKRPRFCIEYSIEPNNTIIFMIQSDKAPQYRQYALSALPLSFGLCHWFKAGELWAWGEGHGGSGFVGWDPPGRTLSTVGGCQLSADSGEGTLDSLQTVPVYLKFAQPF